MGVADEMVTIVDPSNREIGAAPRGQMRAERLIHRATCILVFNSGGELFLQKRTPTKDVYPGYYDAAAGGVVLAGERYRTSAERELAEELGIRNVPLQPLFEFYYEDPGNRVWGRAFSCTYDGPMIFQPEEVEDGVFCTVDEVLAGRYAPVTPDTLEVLRRYAAGAE